MKKLMLLGGSRYLMPVINTAHDMGIYVITCDYLPDNYAHKYADEYLNISVVDKEKVLQAAEEAKIDGIMSFATDPGVVTAAYVAEKLGLPFCGSYETVSILQDKGKFREFLRMNNFNVPMHGSYENAEQALNDIEKFTFPVIVKPVDSAGSKGVMRVDEKEQIKSAVDYALSYSLNNKVIVEEFIVSKGFSTDCDCFSIDGKFKFISFSDQRFDQNAKNPFTPAAYSWPPTMDMANQEELKSELQRLADLLSLKSSIYNIETRVGLNGKPYIMEVSPRGGGNRLSEMMKYVSGTDLIKNSILAALGLECEDLSDPKYNGYFAEIILHGQKEGSFSKLEISDKISDSVVEIDLWVEKGMPIKQFNGANDTIGVLVLKFETREELELVLSDVDKYVNVLVD